MYYYYYFQGNIAFFTAEMRGLLTVVLLVVGINTILSLSLPVIEGYTYTYSYLSQVIFYFS